MSVFNLIVIAIIAFILYKKRESIKNIDIKIVKRYSKIFAFFFCCFFVIDFIAFNSSYAEIATNDNPNIRQLAPDVSVAEVLFRTGFGASLKTTGILFVYWFISGFVGNFVKGFKGK